MNGGRWAPWPGHYDHYTVAAGGKTIGGNMAVEAESMRTAETPLKPGDYVALYPSLWGSGTIMALSGNLTLGVIAYKNGLMSSWGFQLPKRAFAAGEELKGTVLFVKGSYPELPNNTLAETIRTTMGIGGKPSYSLELRIGHVIGSLYRIRAEAQNGVWAAMIGKADLPVLLPIEVAGLNGGGKHSGMIAEPRSCGPYLSAMAWAMPRSTLARAPTSSSVIRWPARPPNSG